MITNLEDIIPKYEINWLEQMLSSVPFVMWDRFTEDGTTYQFYGWIDREKDQYKDFVVLKVNLVHKDIEFITSSEKYSKEISVALLGKKSLDDHSECIRVEQYFNSSNIIRL